MVQLLEEQDDAYVQRILRAAPALGAPLAADWQLWLQNPAMPFCFYRVGENALLKYGASLTLCGVPQRTKELELFLRHERVQRMETDGWAPAGWQTQRHMVMRYAAKGGRAKSVAKAPAGFVPDPAPAGVMQVLESREPFTPVTAHDSFYTTLCTRTNHGLARVVALRGAEGGLVATAGLYALLPWHGYLGAVETLPGHEGKGHASALIEWLLAEYGDRDITLMCEPSLEEFYRRLGFAPTGESTCVATQIVPNDNLQEE